MIRTVRELMTRPVVTVDASVRVEDALTIGEDQRVRRLVVVRNAEIVGVVCRCDLEQAPADEPVLLHMSGPVIAVRPTLAVGSAATLMRVREIGCLPVVDFDGHLVGIVTRTDLHRVGMERGAFQ